ncbi:hypothetical protein FG876_02640 [Pediococcus acidilactici]|nr:hypothetical protein [Pediococcus acidilactici]RXA14329.1 hypothetical protein EQ833_07760 [Pediococcus acidilactici]RXA51455.1 hypothetical protein EQ834_02645 [Pediococcus acidilactici]RXA54661.1 hypothetical protein EQ838_02040 [Pediococcus acidilactici]RXA74526.1 hypothetical protein EQ837_09150 [Pediococcus acidilactici]
MIKFRAWIKTGIETYDYVKPMTIQQMVHSKKSTFSLKQLNDLVDFEQFTGLKDVNGKEIYEGDIITSKPNGQTFESPKIGVVKRSKISAGWCYETATDEYEIWTSGKYRTYEVIGNVHTNTELLEEEN